MELIGKKILIISPQFWGKMLISKHHYAVELAKRGNEVYFLNPPNAALSEEVIIDELDIDNLFIIHHKLNFPYKLKFRSETLFHLFMKLHIKLLLKKINVSFDIIWSFDLGNLYPFKLFPKNTLKIFHPVDEPLNATAIKSAKGANLIFSTTKEILNKYTKYKTPKYFINHGLKEIFLTTSTYAQKTNHTKIRVGFSGNLLRKDIDRDTLLKIINQNTDIEFNCWGSYNIQQSNISGNTDDATKQFIRTLRAAPNVILHGVKTTENLAEDYQNMQAFLICYKVVTNPLIGENYHKTLEFISTGKVIISHTFSSYKNKPNLVQMNSAAINNSDLPNLFKQIIEHLENYNTEELNIARKKFAKDNLYQKQIDRIESILLLSNIE
jgi:hypothetical protein